MDNTKLIAEAHDHVAHLVRGIPGSMADVVRRGESADLRIALVVRLADALEAAEAELTRRDTVRALHEEGDRVVLSSAIGAVVWNASNHPKPSAVLGQDISPLRAKLVDAVIAAGFTRAAAPVKAEARDEAYRRYKGDTILSEVTGERESHDDWGYAECQRAAFIAGAEWRFASTDGDAK